MKYVVPNPITFAVSVWRAFIYWARFGRLEASPTEISRRRHLCDICVHLSDLTRQCDICTCFVDAKILLRSEFCPNGRWKRERSTERLVWRVIERVWQTN